MIDTNTALTLISENLAFAQNEYIKTPYVINCGRCELEQDDFLYKKGMVWGKPDFNQLMEFMKDAYDKKLRYMDHSYTKFVTSSCEILKSFKSI